MNIAVLGGAFDPPHLGHYLVASQVKELLKMDEVWLMPCYTYFPEFPVKFTHITTPRMRFDMAGIFRSYGLKVSDFEFMHNKKSRTIDTLRMLEKKFPRDTFSWIIGSDTLPTFHLWNEWKDLVKKHNLIVFPRDTDFKTLEKRVMLSFQLDSLPSNIKIIGGDVIVSNIASTHIRKRIRADLPVHTYIHTQVEAFIRKYNLYK